MANAVITHPQSRSIAGVTSRLRRLRARIATWFVVDGLARIGLALLLLIGLDLFLDWFFEMDRPQRIVMLGMMAVAVVWLVWRFLVRPLRRHVSEDALCLQVEKQNAQLGESLISALQFSRQSDFEAKGVSSAMVAATIDRGITSAEGLSFEQTLHRQRFLWNFVLLAVAVAGLIGIAVGTQMWQPLSIWYKRNVLLSEDVRWPQKTVFVIEGVEDGVLTIPNGDDWLLIARVHKDSEVVPEDASIEIRRAGRRRVEVMQPLEPAKKQANAGDKNDESAPPNPPAAPSGTATEPGFHHTFQQVLEEFEFRIVCSSGRSDWIQVKLVDRPEVKSLTISVTDPKYAGGRARTLESGLDKHYVLKGSALTVEGRASKTLAGAYLIVGEKSFALRHDGDAFSLPVPRSITEDTTYRIRLVDRAKIKLPNSPKATPLESQPHTSFELKLREDTVPKLQLKLAGVGAMVVPSALLPCEVDVSDDLEVTRVRLKWEWQDHSGAPPHRGEVPLDELNKELAERNSELRTRVDALHRKRSELVKQQQGLSEDSAEFQRLAAEISQVGFQIQQVESERRRFRFTYSFDLKPLKIAENSNLRITFEADDNDTVSGPKTGRVTESLEVVSEATLRNRLLERENRQRDILERKRDEQDELYTKTAQVLARIRNQKDAGEADRALLQKLQRDQQRMARDLKSVADRLSKIVQEYRNNRIVAEEDRLKEREEKIIAPLRKLAETPVPEAAKLLMQARGNLTKPQTRNQSLSDATKKQEAIRDTLNDVIAQMSKSANFQKAVNKAFQTLRAQKDLFDQINDMLKKQLKKLPGN